MHVCTGCIVACVNVCVQMSASNVKSKIDLLDSAKQVRNKVNSAYCLPPSAEDWESTNGVLAFAKVR
jgi:tryptophanyl-tRNA synthetase